MPKIKKLNNGLRLVVEPMKGTRTATILILFATGSKYENKRNSGLSHFLEHMFFKGTVNRPTTLVLSSELDSLGAEFNAFTGKEMTGYWIKVDSAKINRAIEIVSDMLFNSLFKAEEVEREKGVIIEEINMYEDNPLLRIEDIFEQCLYGDTPAGRDVVGRKENIRRFRRSDLLSYLKNQYAARHSVVCLAGDIDSRALSIVKKYFSNFKKGNWRDKPAVREKQSAPAVKLFYKKTDQAHLSLGVRTFGLGHRDEFVLKVIGVILGGAMSSRLFTELRERRGLAYSVHTGAEFYSDSGYLTTQAGVPVAKIKEAIKIILAEYKKIATESISNKELQKIKDLISGRLSIQLESSDSVASWHGQQVILRGSILSPQDFLRKIRSVKAADIGRVAKKIFVEDKLNLAIIGPYKDKDEKRFEKILRF